MIERLKRFYRKLFRNPPKVSTNIKHKIERHGSVYGGWNIISDSLNADSVVYSFGIGRDYSFDKSIIKKYDCNLYAFDPTPEVISWIDKDNNLDKFIFTGVGLSDHDGKLTFYTPEVEGNISHSAFASETTSAVEVPCKKLGSIMKHNNHISIDLLKMDIEGFEDGVIKNLIAENIFPKQMLIEFHHFFSQNNNKTTEDLVELLKQVGYKLYNISDSFCEYSFVYSGNSK